MKPSDNNSKPSDQNVPPPGQDEFSQVVDKIRDANNILVTVSTDPTVDQFAACIGLTLILNKMNRHANAVFSGKVPSTLDFLKPEKTLEQNTDSLRDFIIALDKSKADKLRYKVENDVVKIFITPYRTSISEKDLQFSQGDLNVDVVVALGVQDKNHIDQAILAHGRILHDATVISINTSQHSKIGNINWADDRASSLCEMVADVASELDSKVFDTQNSTALLTGIVAETDRYSNDKAAPHTMSVAGLLMSAGASTQLVSTELANEVKMRDQPQDGSAKDVPEGGVLEIDHPKTEEKEEPKEDEKQKDKKPDNDLPPPPVPPTMTTETPSGDGNQSGPGAGSPDDDKKDDGKPHISGPKVMHEPPEFTGRLTANSVPEEGQYTGSTDPLSRLPDAPLIGKSENDDDGKADTLFPSSDNSGPAKGKDLQVNKNQTLSDIEKSVNSPHLSGGNDSSTDATIKDVKGQSGLDEARDAVSQAEGNAESENPRPEARQDMGTTELSSDLNGSTSPESSTTDPNNPGNSRGNDSPPPPTPPPYLPQA